MRIPIIRGIIDRRILVNYRVRPDILAKLLPPPFRPKLVSEWGMAGICLIRLKRIRPRPLPAIGLSSENAAHRIAVEWAQYGVTREGAYVPRRDTSSWVNTLVGGRLFPGVHHHARFRCFERNGQYGVAMSSDDCQASLTVAASASADLPKDSIFGSLEQASAFFQRGSSGYSPTHVSRRYDELELRTSEWSVEPLAIERLESSFFDDRSRFPAGSAELDCALLMRSVEHQWIASPAASL